MCALWGEQMTCHSLDRWGIFFHGSEQAECTIDSGIQEIFLNVLDILVEGRGRMDDGFERRVGLDDIVKSAFNSDILDNNRTQLAFLCIGEQLLESLGFFLGAYACNHGMALLQQLLKNVYRHEATTA